jgi:ubiquinone biosynthesis protein UbiJ
VTRWEEQLSHITGDIIARQIGNVARLSGKFISDSRNTLEQDVSEYLQEEARLLPTHTEVNDFLEDVDQLRSDVDRLNARIERLLQARDSQP